MCDVGITDIERTASLGDVVEPLRWPVRGLVRQCIYVHTLQYIFMYQYINGYVKEIVL